MSNSILMTNTVKFRQDEYLIREITYGERKQFMKLVQNDPASGGEFIVSSCTLSANGGKRFSGVGDLEEQPPGLVDTLSREILKLSGVNIDDSKGGETEKKA